MNITWRDERKNVSTNLESNQHSMVLGLEPHSCWSLQVEQQSCILHLTSSLHNIAFNSSCTATNYTVSSTMKPLKWMLLLLLVSLIWVELILPSSNHTFTCWQEWTTNTYIWLWKVACSWFLYTRLKFIWHPRIQMTRTVLIQYLFHSFHGIFNLMNTALMGEMEKKRPLVNVCQNEEWDWLQCMCGEFNANLVHICSIWSALYCPWNYQIPHF